MWMIQSVMLGRTCWAEKATNERHRCEPSARSLSRQRRRPVWRAAQFLLLGECGPGLIEGLWDFAQSAYLDSPLPSLFKERLFVHLSRFCPVRYCIVRHVGFLIGAGRPAGDATGPAGTVAEVLSLLQRPVPNSAAFDRAVSRLLDHPVPEEIPASATPFEYELFDVLTILFLDPLASGRAREAMRAAVGETNFEYLIAYLAFIRAAHYWTETHPN
jgi:hypothetical protein